MPIIKDLTRFWWLPSLYTVYSGKNRQKVFQCRMNKGLRGCII